MTINNIHNSYTLIVYIIVYINSYKCIIVYL